MRKDNFSRDRYAKIAAAKTVLVTVHDKKHGILATHPEHIWRARQMEADTFSGRPAANYNPPTDTGGKESREDCAALRKISMGIDLAHLIKRHKER